MKAALIYKYGKHDRFRLERVQLPQPKPDEIQLRVAASSVNPVDCKTRSGSIAFLSGWKFPRILGADFSGVVTACGSQVSGFKPGDAVCGFSSAITEGGAYAQYMCCKASRAVLRPSGLSDAQAAVVPLAASTAYQGLYREGGMKPGMRVLVIGATGGVGHYAVQLARAAGCQVTGVCHSRNEELARQLGCEQTICYDRERSQAERPPVAEYDLIFDAAAKWSFMQTRKQLSPRGCYVTTVPYPPEMIMRMLTAASSGRRCRFISVSAQADDLRQLLHMAEQGVIRSHIEKTFPLELISLAHQWAESGNVRGKIAIHIDSPEEPSGM